MGIDSEMKMNPGAKGLIIGTLILKAQVLITI